MPILRTMRTSCENRASPGKKEHLMGMLSQSKGQYGLSHGTRSGPLTSLDKGLMRN